MSQNANNPYFFAVATALESFFTSAASTTSSPLAVTASPSPSPSTSTLTPSSSPPTPSSNKTISPDNVSQIITWTLSHISFYGLRLLLQLETQFPIIGSAASASERLDFFAGNNKYGL